MGEMVVERKELIFGSFFCFKNCPFPVMGCSAAEATGLGFVCFIVINPLCCQPTELIWVFLFHKLSNLPPPPPQVMLVAVVLVAATAAQIECQPYLTVILNKFEIATIEVGGEGKLNL